MADAAETIEESARRIGRHVWVEARLFEIVGSWAGSVTEPRSRALFGRQSAHHGWHVELWHGLLPALPHVADTQLVTPGGSDAETVAVLAELDEQSSADDAVNPSGSGGAAEAGDARDARDAGDARDAAEARGVTEARYASRGRGGDTSRGRGGDTSGGRGGDTPTDAVDRLVALYREALPALVAAYDDHLAHTSPIADGPTIRVLRLVRTDLTEDIAAGEALIEALMPVPNPSA